MKVFHIGVIYFTRTESLGMLWNDGRFDERGGNWKCGLCLHVLLREESPREHAEKYHPLHEGSSTSEN